MKKMTVVIPGTVASVKHFIPIPDGARLVGMEAVVNSAQTAGTALVIAGKAGAAHQLLSANLGTTGANGIGKVARATDVASVTEDEKKQIFNRDVPLQVDVQLVVVGSVGITLYLDEYAISSFAG